MKDVFTENGIYKFIYYTSIVFGTWMTNSQKTHKVIAYTISLLWCLAIVANQIDYVMKPWMEERKEKRKQDMTFEQIIRFDFWTYNAVYFLSCFLPLIGRKIEVNTSKNPTRDTCGRIVVVFLLVVGNLIPIYFSYDYSSVQKKTNSTYNLLFQDVCKLGILTVDLQFAWFCWSLKDGFSKLNGDLQLMISSEVPVAENRTRRNVAPSVCDRRYELRRFDVEYGHLTDGAKTVRGACEERILTNTLCYMFNTICGLFDTISAYRTPDTPVLLVVIHMSWVINCAGRITLVCFAASSVVEQDDHLHNLAQISKEKLGTKSNCWEMKQFLRRLAHSKVQFDFCDMVTIDKTLLASAVISVVSYLVIVLQYNYS